MTVPSPTSSSRNAILDGTSLSPLPPSLSTDVSIPASGVYRRLEIPTGQFRLIKIKPVAWHADGENWRLDDIIQCELQTHEIHDDTSKWSALSYCWSHSRVRKSILLEGMQTEVSSNVFRFLRRMREEKSAKWYFIDALCINQNDTLERGNQVNMMAEIYKNAQEVVIWIPLENEKLTDDIDEARSVIEERRADSEAYSSQSGEEWSAYDVHGYSTLDQDWTRQRRKMICEAMVESRYWSRLWIVQELLLARQVNFRMAEHVVSHSEVIAFLKESLAWRGKRGQPPSMPESFSRRTMLESEADQYSNMAMARILLSWYQSRSDAIRSGHLLPFYKAVGFFSYQQCSEWRDRIFALRGITNTYIIPDYTVSRMGLFTASFAQYLLSLGFMTTDYSSQIRWYHPKKYTNFKLAWADGARGIGEGCNGTDYLELFDLTGRDPMVRLIIRRVVKFFAPGFEDGYTMTMAGPSYFADDEELAAQTKQAFEAVLAIPSEKPEDQTLWNISVRVGKLIAIPFGARYRAAAANLMRSQKELENLSIKNAVLTAPEDNGATMTFKEWEAFVDDICDRLWKQHESAIVGQMDEENEDEQAGDVDEESWELID